MNRADSVAANLEAHKTNCAQSVLTAYCEEFGLDKNLAMKLALGFGGGMGGMGKTCGAVVGAFMVIGLHQNSGEESTPEARRHIMGLIKKFTKRYVGMNGSIECRELKGRGPNNPGTTKKSCPQLAHDAVEILESMEL